MSEARVRNPLIDQFIKGGIPKDVRAMAAQGSLPLGPADLAELLVILTKDSEVEVREAATATLKARPVDELLPILKDRNTPVDVLSWGVLHRDEGELRQIALQNHSVPDEALEELAAVLPRAQAELVVINQVRLLRRTSLLVALESNPDLDNDQRRRLRELREEFKIGEEAEAPPAPEPVPEPEPEPAPEPEPEPEPEPLSDEEAVDEYLSDEEKENPERVSTLQKLNKMNTADKLVRALKGSREERGILIRERNRLVTMGVLGSPRVTESEVESFAAMKSVSDEVLRTIGQNRQWTRSYPIMSNLIHNPRTPIAISMGFVSRLNRRDMKALATDRNVPEAIRKAAQRFTRAGQRG